MSFIKWMFISIIIIGIFIRLGYEIVEIIDLVRSIGENGLKIEALRGIRVSSSWRRIYSK